MRVEGYLERNGIKEVEVPRQSFCVFKNIISRSGLYLSYSRVGSFVSQLKWGDCILIQDTPHSQLNESVSCYVIMQHDVFFLTLILDCDVQHLTYTHLGVVAPRVSLFLLVLCGHTFAVLLLGLLCICDNSYIHLYCSCAHTVCAYTYVCHVHNFTLLVLRFLNDCFTHVIITYTFALHMLHIYLGSCGM